MSFRAGLGTQSRGAGPYSPPLHLTRDSLSGKHDSHLEHEEAFNRLEIYVYGHGLCIPKLPRRGTAYSPTLFIPVCRPLDRGQGPHTSKGPAQKKTSRSRHVHANTWVRRTRVWFCREAQLGPSEGRRKSFRPASSSDKQAPAGGERTRYGHTEIATEH